MQRDPKSLAIGSLGFLEGLEIGPLFNDPVHSREPRNRSSLQRSSEPDGNAPIPTSTVQYHGILSCDTVHGCVLAMTAHYVSVLLLDIATGFLVYFLTAHMCICFFGDAVLWHSDCWLNLKLLFK